MKRFSLCLSVGVLLINTSCSVSGEIRNNFYQSGERPTRAIPLKVGLVPDKQLPSQRLMLRSDGGTIEIGLYPGIFNTVRTELANTFQEITVLEGQDKVANEDLIAIVSAKYDVLEAPGKSRGFRCKLGVDFKEPRSGLRIMKYDGDSSFPWQGGFSSAGAFLGGMGIIVLTAGLGFPLAVHINNAGQLDNNIPHVEECTVRAVQELSSNIQGDPQLVAYVKKKWDGPMEGSAPGSIEVMPTAVAARPPATIPLSEEDRLSLNDPRGVKVIGKPPADYVAETFSKSWAVVIGIDDYEKAPRLKYATADAKAVAGVLRQQGFQVAELYNRQATKATIEGELSDKLLDRVGEQDRVVIFYAGHGETKTVKGGKTMGYLLPVEGQPDALGQTSVSMGRIKELADALPSKQVLFLVDVCYGGIAGQQFRSTLPPMTVAYLKMITRERGRQLISAGGPDQQAMESPEWGHSVFTYYLLEGLKGLADLNDDGIIPASELYSYLDSRVFSAAQLKGHTQRPELWSLAAEKGEFVFIPGKKADRPH